MFRKTLGATVLALLALSAGPAGATETTSVGYSSAHAAHLSVAYHPPVDVPDVGPWVELVTKADCTFEAAGSNLTGGVQAVFVSHAVVLTPSANAGLPPTERLPAATAVTCEIRNSGNTFQWTAFRPGVAAYGVTVATLPFDNLEICAQATVFFGDGSSHTYPKNCHKS